MEMKEWVAKQSLRIYGPPPSKDAPKVATWMFVRRIYSRVALLTIPAWIVLALDGAPTWLWIAFGISAAIWLQGLLSVNLRIRRLRNSPSDR